jgi:hypothetical protein
MPNTNIAVRLTLRDSMRRAPRANTLKRWSPVPVFPEHFERAAIGECHAVGEALRRATLHDIVQQPSNDVRYLRREHRACGGNSGSSDGVRAANLVRLQNSDNKAPAAQPSTVQ